MKIDVHPDFKKSYKKRIFNNPKLAARTQKRIELFVKNRNNPVLKDHSLTGSRKEYRSFSITGDIRIIYLPISDNHVLFVDIGSHNQVY